LNWSPAKEKLFRLERNTAVSAGAGSGKTAALVELYLRLLAGETSLERPLEVEEIVAITFTEKAATEMRERVRRGIEERKKGTGGEWERLLRDLSSASISTFHSFCSRILRENPAEAGVDPCFTVLDEYSSRTELREAIDGVIEEALDEASEPLLGLLRLFPLSGRGRGKGIVDHLEELCRRLAGAGMTAADLSSSAETLHREGEALHVDGLRELAALAAEVRRILSGKEKVFHRSLAPFPSLLDPERLHHDHPGAPATAAFLARCLAGNWGNEKPVKDALQAALEKLQLGLFQLRSREAVAALTDFAGRGEAAYARRKGGRGALDYDDLMLRTRDLLRRNAAVRDEYRRRFPVVMVDEFQDTNPLQKELLSLLCGPDQRLFVVGDPKQSIYLFRGADVEVFVRTRDEIASSGGDLLYFQESFRSRPAVIDFVNSFFAEVMTGGEAFDVPYEAGDVLEPQRPADGGPPAVELLSGDPDAKGAAKRTDEARRTGERILRLASGKDPVRVYDLRRDGESAEFVPRPPRFGDMAILFRRFSNLKVFERELRLHGIPYYVVRGRGFYRCREILDILNFLRYLEYGRNLVALAGVLRSPLCGVSDETLYLLSRASGGLRAWEKNHSAIDFPEPDERERLDALAALLRHLRPLRDRLTLAELLEEIIAATGFASILLTTFQGDQKAANLRKLVEFSRSFTGAGKGLLRRFVNRLERLVEEEPTEAEAVISAEGENVVRLMTVHQSKGLEFPVVFVPELGAGSPADHGAVGFDEELGIGIKLPLPGGEWGESLARRKIAERRRKREAAEQKRLFYVAATRARDHLVLSGEGRGEWRKWIDRFLAGPGAGLVTVADGDQREAAAPVPSPSKVLPDPAVVLLAAERVLSWRPPAPAVMTFSPTALEDYRHCPRKYYLKVVLGMDEGLFAELLGERSGKGRHGSSSGLEKGNLAHALLERLDFAAPPEERRAECRRLLRSLGGALSDDEGEEVVRAVLGLAEGELGGELARLRLLREHPFLMRLSGRGEYRLQGAMDLIAESAESVTVYDYKYADPRRADLEGYRFQVRTYMLALKKGFPGRDVRGGLLFLPRGEEEPVECGFAEFEAGLIETMDEIRERSGVEDFELLHGCDGSHCPFRRACGR
jgi:ATP-dependent helicase/nuclease subunit A